MLAAAVQHACPAATPADGRDSGGAPAEQRVPDRQRRVLARGDDDEDRDPEEGGELGHGENLALLP